MQDITKANNEYHIKYLPPKVGAYDLSKSCSLIWILSWLLTCWVLTRWKFIDLVKLTCSGPDHSNRPKCVRLSEAARSARHDEQDRDGAELRRANWRRFQVIITGFPWCVRFISHVVFYICLDTTSYCDCWSLLWRCFDRKGTGMIPRSDAQMLFEVCKEYLKYPFVVRNDFDLSLG